MARIVVVFHSITGNVATLARAVAEGASDSGAEVRLRRVEELLKDETLSARALSARREFSDVPVAVLDNLRWSEGAAFGSPTRYGNMSHQLKAFIDSTGVLWRKGELVGKVAAVFTSTSTQHGGQETTLLTMMVPLFHLGYLVLGLPYAEARQTEMDYIQGGSPYGASSVSAMRADRPPTENDLILARSLGRRLAETADRLTR